MKTKPLINIFVDNNSENSCECWYFKLLGRHLNNVALKFHTKEVAPFIKQAKKSKDDHEYFVALLDADIDYNNIQESLRTTANFIEDLHNTRKVKVCLSSRCWENWVVWHFREFHKFTFNDTKIPIPEYEKKKNWYTSREEMFMSTLEVAINRSVKQRRLMYKNNDIDEDLDSMPDFSDRKILLTILESCNPISYVDLLIKKIFVLNGTPIKESQIYKDKKPQKH